MINDVNVAANRSATSSSMAVDSQTPVTKPSTIKSEPLASSALSGAIEHMVQQGVPIDLDRIIAVRNAIADGQYPVDAMKIAQKIVEFDQPGIEQ